MQIAGNGKDPVAIPFNDVFGKGLTFRRQISCLIRELEANGAMSDSVRRITSDPGWRGIARTLAAFSSRDIGSTLKPCSQRPMSRVSSFWAVVVA